MYRIPRRDQLASTPTSSNSLEDEYVQAPRATASYSPRPQRRPHAVSPITEEIFLDVDVGGIGASLDDRECVVVVAPGPVVAAAAAANAAQYRTRRRRPPTPIEGDGFPSVLEDPISTQPTSTVAVTAASSAAASEGDSSARYHDISLEEISEPRYFYRPKMSGRMALFLMGGSALLLLAMLLAYNSDFDRSVFHKSRSLFKRRSKRSTVRDANVSENAARDRTATTPSATALSVSSGATSPALTEDPEEFELRLRQMVSHFWSPALNDAPLTVSTRRPREHGFDDPTLGGRGGGAEDVDGDDRLAVESTVESPPPVKKKRPRANWFLVQLRRRHGPVEESDVDNDGHFWQDVEDLSVDDHLPKSGT